MHEWENLGIEGKVFRLMYGLTGDEVDGGKLTGCRNKLSLSDVLQIK